MKQSWFLLCTLFLLSVNSHALAKGYPSKIVIQGSNLQRPIEITDRETLGRFSPWYGQFIDWANSPVAKPADRASYEILFYVLSRHPKSPQNQIESRLIFNFLYSPDPAGGPGLIYLPARTDDKYRVNQAAITRDKDDGKWHQASSEWDAALKPRLPAFQRAKTAASTVMQRGNRSSRYVIVASSIVGLGLMLLMAGIIRRRKLQVQT